jgi:hypothetical protein
VIRSQLLLSATLAVLLVPSACAHRDAGSPITIAVARGDEGCTIRVNDRQVSSDELSVALRAWPNRRAILQYQMDTPYRCIGGAIFLLQRERYRVVGDPPFSPSAETKGD